MPHFSQICRSVIFSKVCDAAKWAFTTRRINRSDVRDIPENITGAHKKAQNVLDEPRVRRQFARSTSPVSVTVAGELNGTPISFIAKPRRTTVLASKNATTLANVICGLETRETLAVDFSGTQGQPRTAFICDEHVGPHGSLRRTATLMSDKRLSNARIIEALTLFGLSDLLSCPGTLKQRINENGKGLSAAQTLRIDLARAILAQADVIVIASSRWQIDPHQTMLLRILHDQTVAPVILASPSPADKLTETAGPI